MSQRITKVQLDQQVVRVANMLKASGVKGPFVLYPGNSSYKIPNRLMIGVTNVWPDGMAGFTTREAYNALRLMAATLGTLPD